VLSDSVLGTEETRLSVFPVIIKSRVLPLECVGHDRDLNMLSQAKTKSKSLVPHYRSGAGCIKLLITFLKTILYLNSD
jgi:hypothetical protein